MQFFVVFSCNHFYFGKGNSDAFSFSLEFRVLNVLSCSIGLAKGLSILLVFLKHQLLVLLIVFFYCFFILCFIYLYSDIYYFFPSTCFEFNLLFFFLVSYGKKLGC